MLEVGEEKERYFVVVLLQTGVIIMNQCAVQALAEGRSSLCYLCQRRKYNLEQSLLLQ